MRSFDSGPKMASKASRFSDFVASAKALAASSGDANVFCAAWVSAGFCCLLQAVKNASKRRTNKKNCRERIQSPTDIFDPPNTELDFSQSIAFVFARSAKASATLAPETSAAAEVTAAPSAPSTATAPTARTG